MKYLNILGYICIPLAALVHYWLGHGKPWGHGATFVLAALSVIPLAHLMGEATEHLSEKTGPTLGGLLNATFGNAAEIIIGIIALTKGLNDIVKASLTGSILGNLLLVAGAAMLAGGWRREKQLFSRGAAEANAGLLVVAVAAMLMPAIFDLTGHASHAKDLAQTEEKVSIGTSIVLLAVYGLGLLFTLRTHKHIFSRGPTHSDEEKPGIEGAHGVWSVKRSVIVLLAASVGVGIVAEWLVDAADHTAQSLGWSPVFVGVILLAIIGNAAEHSTAVLLAMRDDMDTAMTICYQSSIQIALFATPFLVLLSWGFWAAGMKGPDGMALHPMNLVFTPMEVAAVVLTVGIVIVLAMNGETNWFEGALLLALYVILGIMFFYTPGGEAAAVHSLPAPAK
ncbi:MAG: calcium/proton exchanger [Phycisphaerae bacterium]|nr:calcium/proton exchanger [Tepidisphaeraceae bacterium]